MADISKAAVLASLAISQPTLQKTDKGRSRTLTATEGAASDAAKVVVKLFGKEYEKVKTALSRIRSTHYRYTSPWIANGPAILSAKLLLPYQRAIGQDITLAEEEIDLFCKHYEDVIEAQRVRLGGFFDQNLFPYDPDDLRRAFNIKVTLRPVPAAGDWRVEVSDQISAQVREQLEQEARQAERAVLADAYGKLVEVVGKAAEKLADPDTVYRDSLIGNVLDVCELCEKLNCTDDPELNEKIKTVREKVGKYHPQTLREDKALRQQVADDAEALKRELDRLTSW